ncbi:capsid protein [Miresoil virus 443]|uniref:Capsid protein n=1 Tax=Miresoil virus 443 TaxID=2911463 RepID=A0A9E8YXC9_9VIRU|nr:capsid protein [Miresoil virus 443]
MKFKRRYKKKSFGRKKRWTRKKRSYRKKKSGWDTTGQQKVKCQFKCQVSSTTYGGENEARYTVYWNTPITSGAPVASVGVDVFSDSPEFNTYCERYQRYKIVGLLMEMQPAPNLGAQFGTNIVIQGMEIVSDPVKLQDGLIVPSIMRALSYKEVPFRRTKRYFKVAKTLYDQGFNWLDTGGSATSVNQPGDQSSTLWRVKCQGFGDGVILGQMAVTWYCVFKDPVPQ